MNGLNLSAMGSSLANLPENMAGLQLAQAKASLGQSQAAEEANKVQGGLALNRGLAEQMAGREPTTDPFEQLDQQAQAHSQNAQQLAQQGFGDRAQSEQQAAQQAQAQKRQLALSRAAMASRSGNYDALKDIAPHMGIQGVEQVQYDPKTDAVKLMDKDGNVVGGMPKETLDTLDLTPEQRANMEWHKFSASMMAGSREKVATINAGAKENVEKLKETMPKEVIGQLQHEVAQGIISQDEADRRIKFLDTIKQNGSMAMMMMQMPTGLGPPDLPPDPLRPWRSTSKFQQLIQKEPNYANAVDQFMNGDYPTSSGRGVMVDKKVMQLASQIDPNVTARDYVIKQKALQDPQIIAANAALNHVNDFMGALSKFDNKTQSDILNHSWNWLSQHSKGNEALGELYTTGLSLSEEYGKALGAGQNVTGDMKREAVFNPDAPIKVATSKLHAVGNLIDKTIAAKENVLNRSNPKRIPLNLLDPSSQEVLGKLGISHTPGNRGSVGASPAPTPASPQPSSGGAMSLDQYLKSKGF
jgi:hypothetical protein